MTTGTTAKQHPGRGQQCAARPPTDTQAMSRADAPAASAVLAGVAAAVPCRAGRAAPTRKLAPASAAAPRPDLQDPARGRSSFPRRPRALICPIGVTVRAMALAHCQCQRSSKALRKAPRALLRSALLC